MSEQFSPSDLHLPWVAKETATGWELSHEGGGWLFEMNDRKDRATESDADFIASQERLMKFIVAAGNSHHALIKALEELAAIGERIEAHCRVETGTTGEAHAREGQVLRIAQEIAVENARSALSLARRT